MPSLKTLDWSDFLARPAVAPPTAESLDSLRHKSILVIGAGGSIGSALSLRLAELSPASLVLLEASESHLYTLQGEFAQAGVAAPTIFILGNVCDRPLLEEIFAVQAPNLVFHAAAFKHVPLLEEQPLAAIENNVFGTRSLVAAASGARIVLLSTDKAVEPTSIMGATKRLAEIIVLSAGGTPLRLGNVLATRDSVAEVFACQIRAGLPLTITDPAARRYFLTIEEAVNLLLFAALEPQFPALVAPKLPAPRLVCDLALFMAKAFAPGSPIATKITGARAGDKETELFWSARETVQPAAGDALLRIESPLFGPDQIQNSLAELRAALDMRDVPAAIAELLRMVPEYTPSSSLLAMTAQRFQRALS